MNKCFYCLVAEKLYRKIMKPCLFPRLILCFFFFFSLRKLFFLPFLATKRCFTFNAWYLIFWEIGCINMTRSISDSERGGLGWSIGSGAVDQFKSDNLIIGFNSVYCCMNFLSSVPILRHFFSILWHNFSFNYRSFGKSNLWVFLIEFLSFFFSLFFYLYRAFPDYLDIELNCMIYFYMFFLSVFLF